ESGGWRPPIVKAVAQTGEGIDEALAAIGKHRTMLAETGGLTARRERRARDEVEAIALTALRERFGDLHGHADLASLGAEVVAGSLDPYAAADRLLAAL
ncbi:MAG: methylmalonyl Co-A mutase-associated GTPase MeaB, partial [Nocardioidaceae bacterium]